METYGVSECCWSCHSLIFWDGNASTNVRTNTPLIYDVTWIYAFNKSMLDFMISLDPCVTIVVRLAPLPLVKHRMGKHYVKASFKHLPVSILKEGQDDRNALYCRKLSNLVTGSIAKTQYFDIRVQEVYRT